MTKLEKLLGGQIIEESQWIQIEFIGLSKSGKTKIFEVVSKNDEQTSLAIIKWHPTWRRYALFPKQDTFWEKGCLRFITKFLEKLV